MFKEKLVQKLNIDEEDCYKTLCEIVKELDNIEKKN